MIEHDLTPEELAFLIARTPSGKSSWSSTIAVSHPCVEHDGKQIIAATASITNGRMPTATEIVRAVYGAESRRLAKRKRAAEKAAATRERRHTNQLYRVARAYLDNQLVPGTHCVLCHKRLTDPVPLARGIGPECFGMVLQAVERGTELVNTPHGFFPRSQVRRVA